MEIPKACLKLKEEQIMFLKDRNVDALVARLQARFWLKPDYGTINWEAFVNALKIGGQHSVEKSPWEVFIYFLGNLDLRKWYFTFGSGKTKPGTKCSNGSGPNGLCVTPKSVGWKPIKFKNTG